MLIGALATHAGCHTETIRYYEREGLLQKPSRTTAGYRSYTSEHLEQLNFVRHCRSLGMTLLEIRTLQSFRANPNLACTDINTLLDQHIVRIHQQIEAMHFLKKQLLALRDRCHDNLPASECGILNMLISAGAGNECVCHALAHPSA
jgi:Cd(II)/Pb(II)-responsive transcriptional regulator